eukprot:TRINITY_DN63722_c0_g1_i2.p1 TRINITY_DN63722_c0_g1~~TRINITY_DN63722_c0_g1_i2.p1  ORF type:complete len:994 (+),score=155.55 TRINITY_DN63722_c0_g1_i2:434-2983(+)
MPMRRDADGNPIKDDLPEFDKDDSSPKSSDALTYMKQTATVSKPGVPITAKKELATSIFWKDDEPVDVHQTVTVSVEEPTNALGNAAPPAAGDASADPKEPAPAKIRFAAKGSCVTDEYQPLYAHPNEPLETIIVELVDLDGNLITDTGPTPLIISVQGTDGTPLIGNEIEVTDGTAVFKQLQLVAPEGHPITSECGLKFVAGDQYAPAAGQTLTAFPVIMLDPRAKIQFAPDSSIQVEGQPVTGRVGKPLDKIIVQVVDDVGLPMIDVPDNVLVIEVIGTDGTPLLNNVRPVIGGRAEFDKLKFAAGLTQPLTDACQLKFIAGDGYSPVKGQVLKSGPISLEKAPVELCLAFSPDSEQSNVTAEDQEIRLKAGATGFGPIVVDVLNTDGDIEKAATATHSLSVIASCSDGTPLISNTAAVVEGKAAFPKIALLSGRPSSVKCCVQFAIQDPGPLTFTKDMVVTGPILLPSTESVVPGAELPGDHATKSHMAEKGERPSRTTQGLAEDSDGEDENEDPTNMPTGDRKKGTAEKGGKRDGLSKDVPEGEEEGQQWVDPDPPEKPASGTGGAERRRKRQGSVSVPGHGPTGRMDGLDEGPENSQIERDDKSDKSTMSVETGSRRASEDVLDLSTTQTMEPHENDAAGLLNQFANEFKKLARAAKKNGGKDWQVIAAYRVVTSNKTTVASSSSTTTEIIKENEGTNNSMPLVRGSSRDGTKDLLAPVGAGENVTTTEVPGWNTSAATTKVVTSSTDPKLFEDFAQEFTQLSKLVKEQHQANQAIKDDNSSTSEQITQGGTYRIESQPSPPRSRPDSPQEEQPQPSKHRRRGSRVLRISSDQPLPKISQEQKN